MERLQGERSASTVKQHLACIRMLFDWLVAGQLITSNPAHSVRGPRHSVTKGVTPVLSSEEATALLGGMDVSTVAGLRDRAVMAVMTYTFARVGAVVALRREDYFAQKRRWWLRLHEKNGKVNEMPCHHKLETYLDAYIAAAGIDKDAKGPLFRSALARRASCQIAPCCAGMCGAWCAAVLLMRELRRRLVATPFGPPASPTT